MTSYQGIHRVTKWVCFTCCLSVGLTCGAFSHAADAPPDTDGDGFPDKVEDHWGSDPQDANHFPRLESERVGLWRLNEGIGSVVAEASGVLGEGQLTGSLLPTWQREGDRNYLWFDGANGRLQVAQLPVDVKRKGIALTAWVNVATNIDGVVVGKWPQEGVQGSYTLALLDGHVAMELSLAGTYRPLISPYVISTAGWHFLAATYDGYEMRLYLNGRRVATSYTGGAIDAVADQLTMGQFNGGLSDVSLYNRTFSDGQMAAMYELGRIERGLTRPEFMVDDPPKLTAIHDNQRLAGLDRTPARTAASIEAHKAVQP